MGSTAAQRPGAVAVVDSENRVAGIFTERDVLKKFALSGHDPSKIPVKDLMTTPVELARFSAGAGLLIHDSQYLDSEIPEKHGWGHSTIPQVLALGRTAEVRVGDADRRPPRHPRRHQPW